MSTEVIPSVTQNASPLSRLGAVSRSTGNHSLAARLDTVREFLGDDLIAVERAVRSCHAHSEAQRDDLAHGAAAHLLERPGKRIRPICALLGATLCEVPFDDSIRELAVASELVHAATLLHDDVIDEGEHRRGAATARTVFSNSASILAGDYLLIDALSRVRSAGIGRPGGDRVTAALLDTVQQMIAAEAVQLQLRRRLRLDRDVYLEIAAGKTASLFGWALSAPATLAGAADHTIDTLREVGGALGVAFQLVDDALDFEGDLGATGKDLYADLVQGKVTWPLLVAAESDPTLAAVVIALRDGDEDKNTRRAAALAIAERVATAGGPVATREFARAHADRALAGLATLPVTPARRAVEIVIGAAVSRTR